MHLSASHFTDLILSLRTASTLTPGHLVDLTGFYEQGFPRRDPANAPGAAIVSPDVASERRRPARRPFSADLPRERVVIPAPVQCCPCCGSPRLAKLGESITETLEVIPRQFKVIQTVREKFSCRDCESITQPPAPFHPIGRGRAGPWLLSTILTGKFADHLPLNRQSEAFAREGIDLSTPRRCWPTGSAPAPPP